jgi:zinc protease
MDVVVLEDHRLPTVAMTLRYAAGDRADPPGLAGLAALTSAMMRHSTKHVPADDYDRLLATVGAREGYLNRLDSTTLQVEIVANALELPLWLWSDQMAFFAPDQAQIRSQAVALQGAQKAGQDTEVLGRVADYLGEEMWPPGHPYRKGGTPDPTALQNVDRRTLVQFHDEWFTPDHATLTIVGDVTKERAFDLVEKYFGPVPAPARPSPPAALPAVKLEGTTLVDVSANVPTARVVIRWPTPHYFTKEDAALDVVARILCGHNTAWLYGALVDRAKIASRLWVRQRSFELGSAFEVTIEGSAGHSAAEILTAFDTAMNDVRRYLATAGALDGALYETLIDRIANIDDPQHRADLMAAYTAIVGTPDWDSLVDVRRYMQITPKLVQDAIALWMPSDRRVVALVTPDRSAPAAGRRDGKHFVAASAP